jgi:hypothetical protein
LKRRSAQCRVWAQLARKRKRKEKRKKMGPIHRKIKEINLGPIN